MSHPPEPPDPNDLLAVLRHTSQTARFTQEQAAAAHDAAANAADARDTLVRALAATGVPRDQLADTAELSREVVDHLLDGSA